jgi:alpha-tubulin suppressor-like RCC1 family protein
MPTPNSALGGDVTDIATTYYGTCARMDESGVRCWGWGGYGNLGYASQQNIGDNESPSFVGDIMLE